MNSLHTPLYTSDQIRSLEQRAIAAGVVSGLSLMQRAGESVFAAVIARWPDIKRITVLGGGGNNAGDGYVIANLALQAAYQVRVISLADPEQLPNDALSCFKTYQQSGGQISMGDADGDIDTDLIIDALFGIGLNRRLSADHQSLIAKANQSSAKRVAVDIPSGLVADTGAVLADAVFKADLTVSFIAGKPGLYTGEAVNYTGEVLIADLDLPADFFRKTQATHYRLNKIALPSRPRNAHKGHFGHVLLVGGNHGYSGAIRLAAEAALRSGAGLVSVATRASHSHILAMTRPEIMSHAVENTNELLPLLDKASVVVVGPGLGQDPWAQALLSQIVTLNKPCVWDADALNWLAAHPHKLNCGIATPHPGEAARLLQCTTTDIAKDRFAAVQALQSAFGGVWLLKGAGSLITDGNSIGVSTTGNPGMASGGMGDVLAGICGSLLAQGLSLLEACQLAVYIHGEAADLCAAQAGERGMLASDLIAKLRQCLN